MPLSWAQFLKGKDGQDNEPIRLKTAVLRGALSQGLVLPLSVLPGFGENKSAEGEHFNYYLVSGEFGNNIVDTINVGMDITSLIGVKKYEKKLSPQLAGVARGSRPTWIKRTDEKKLQNYPRILTELVGKLVYFSMKMDGSSMSVYHRDGEFGVCSRDIDLKETEGNSFWNMTRQLDLENKIKSKGNFYLQGELVGPGINGNKIGLTKNEFYAFNVWDAFNNKFLDFGEFTVFCSDIGVNTVPILYTGMFSEQFDSVDKLLAYVNELLYSNGLPAEGAVIRSIEETYSETLKDRLSFKVISNTFAKKYGE